MIFRLNIPQVLYGLFCCFAFLVPLEFILEIPFGIDTIFKPYRVTSLLIIAVYGLYSIRSGLMIRRDIQEDIFLYALFAYGLLISLFRIIAGIFNLGFFYNDLFQGGLYVLTFFIFKALPFTNSQLVRTFQFLVLGLLVNSIYMFYNFFVLSIFTRDSGFMDNPNYTALGLVAVLTYFLLKLGDTRKIRTQLAYIAVLLFFLYVFSTTGSRTGLILLVVAWLGSFFLIPLRSKLNFFVGGFVLLLLALPGQLSELNFGERNILFERVSNSIDSGEEDVRFVIWKGALNAVEQKGYFGMGIGQFKANFSFFFVRESNKAILEMVNRKHYLSTHNDFLAILTDYGVPGLLCYLIFLWQSFKKKLQALRLPTEGGQHRMLVTLTFLIFSCLVIFGMASENFQSPLFWFLLMFSTRSLSVDLPKIDRPLE